MAAWKLDWRTLVQNEGRLKKTWMIAYAIDSVAIRTVSPSGVTRNRIHSFPNEPKAMAWLETQVRKKLSEGYEEVGRARPGRPVHSPAANLQHERKTRALSSHRQWARIEKWFRAQHQDAPLLLPPGVADHELRAAEQKAGVRLPAELRKSLTRHDGSGKAAFVFGRLLPVAELVRVWEGFTRSLLEGNYDGLEGKPIDAIKRVWFSPRWIPVASNDEGEFVFVDLDPSSKGTKGQVIDFTRSSGAVNVLAKNFDAFLGGLADDLEQGKYDLDPKHWVNRTRSKKRS